MEITAIATYDWETVKCFNRYHSLKSSPLKAASVPVLIISGCVILLCVLTSLIFDFFDSTILILFIAYAVLLGLELFIWFVLPKMAYKSKSFPKNATVSYIFKENSFIAESQTNGINEKLEMDYTRLSKVGEDSSYLYLFINPNQAYIVDKSTVTDSESELRHRLIAGVGIKKYRFCK